MTPESWVGHVLGGRYKIEELLGQGGMSSVYRAVDPNLRRTVAVKIIHPHLSNNPEFVGRFEEEAAAVAQLRHSNIIQVYDFNSDAGIYYMVMEYVSGESLLARLRRLNSNGQRLPTIDTLRYAINLCEAVEYAHRRSMIHRDIKPANIMLDLHGQAILMDFGIAKILGGQEHTATGQVVGTAYYMSPEQIRSERFDHRTDIYSIGVTLFEMVHGRPPFEADATMALMMMHLNETPPNLRELHPDTPEELVQIIERAMAKEADDRFHSAGQMASALRKVLGALQGRPLSGALADRWHVFTAAASGGIAGPRSARLTTAAAGAAASGSAVLPEVLVTDGPRPVQKWRLAGGCTVMLMAMACFLAGAAVLANQFLPGGLIWSGQVAATRTAMVETRLAFSTGLPAQTASPLATGTTTPTSSTSTLAAGSTIFPTPLSAAAPTVTIINVLISGDQYRVEYETTGFIESATGKHIHFFFNNIDPKDAGFPGPGPWLMHPGPRPLLISISDRPPDATKICALAADPNHVTYPNSGNCVDLPIATPTP